MKNSILSILILILSATLLTSCEVVGDIFGAGVYTGMFIVVVVIIILIFGTTRIFRRRD